MSTKYLQIITLLFFVTSLVLQLDAALETRIGTAENLNEDHIRLDGKLDEEAWQRGTPLTGFIQNNPGPSRFKASFRLDKYLDRQLP